MSARPQTAGQVAALIDHTVLKPEATRSDIERLCTEALQYQFASVCVNSVFTGEVAERLRGSPVKTCVVVGFPLGANLTSVKVFEARAAMELGAQELDMVLNVGSLKAGDDVAVGADIRAVLAAAHEGGAILKVIIETSLLSEEEKLRACKLVREAGADFIKTSTGFGTAGATEADVALMRGAVGPEMGVKASGGVRTLEALLKMVEAGATRIGTSNGVSLAQEALQKYGI
jgi:deoxyribose-phosphate aldolase